MRKTEGRKETSFGRNSDEKKTKDRDSSADE